MIEFVAHTSHAKTLFSTHYHELTTLDQSLPSLKNVHVAANEYKGELIFLHKVKDGAVDDSYGIQVAKLAHLPEAVISRAQVILDAFEQNNNHGQATNEQMNVIKSGVEAPPIEKSFVSENEHSYNDDTQAQSSHQFEQAAFDLFDYPAEQSEVETEIKQLNLSNMTPIEALVKLSELQNS